MNSRQRRKLEAEAFNKFKALREKAYSEVKLNDLPWNLWIQFHNKWKMKKWRELMKVTNDYN